MTNFVFIMTDTQNRDMVGVYGNPRMDTPNLDRLANQGMRFNRAYTTCPLCTPARSGIFTGQHPQVNGAWANNMAPSRSIPMMGEIFSSFGFDVAYSGKWHLDGSGYFGDGVAGGGFPQDWWYDGKCYLEDIGPEMAESYRQLSSAQDLRDAGFTESTIWGHRVADRAISFLEHASDKPFVLAVSFDEPHGPFVAPPEYWERFGVSAREEPCNFRACLGDKPRLQQIHGENVGVPGWDSHDGGNARFFGCNSYIDREIGRVVDAVDAQHPDTVVIYTSDHGDMLGAHGLKSKGPMMYEEITNVPFIVRGPEIARGTVSEALVSHIDIIPTMLDIADISIPESLPGVSLVPVLESPNEQVRDKALISFARFAINHDDWGEFYPIRCLTDGRYKLVVNLDDSDEFYDLANDPGEMKNLIDRPETEAIRDQLHNQLLDEMDRIRDPFRSYRWGARRWRTVREPFYHGGQRRNRPEGFPFEPSCIEAG